jgi:hypothetical protein
MACGVKLSHETREHLYKIWEEYMWEYHPGHRWTRSLKSTRDQTLLAITQERIDREKPRKFEVSPSLNTTVVPFIITSVIFVAGHST